MIHLAYDGSLNGDWVARYAIRMASASVERLLVVLHVQDDGVGDRRLEAKRDRLLQECESADVDITWRTLPATPSVTDALLSALPRGPEHVVICGTRAQPGHRGFLSGTVSARLLHQQVVPVMAIRVVQPGLLGSAHRFLIPLSGHPRGIGTTWPFLSLLLSGGRRVDLLRVMEVSRLWRAHVSEAKERALRTEGAIYLRRVIEQIGAERGEVDYALDARAVVSDDWAREVLVEADRLKSQMMLLGATERTLPSRVFSANPLERILRESPCDVGICRGI